VQEFWTDHPDYRGTQTDVYRRSISRHLVAAGSAARGDGERREAMKYLAAALRLNPLDRDVWMGFAKTLLVRPHVPRWHASDRANKTGEPTR
jgi:hypothetical protein